MPWWRDALIYQIYPRSFQDSDGDGVGDLSGIERRLDYLHWLGADAIWLSPIYPSPQADLGYDVADYSGVDPVYGDLAAFDSLLAAAHARDIRVVMDLVPCHTSIEHPWFREHPDWYIWSDRDGPRNNWLASFGGSAWSPDPYGRGWYLHSFYPEQPDLDWRNPEVVHAMQDVVRFWLERGVDGFRLDAIDRLVKDAEFRDDPPASQPFGLPVHGDYGELDHVYSMNRPEIDDALGALRAAAGDTLLVGEVYLPSHLHPPYLKHLDLAFGFELFHSPWNARLMREAIERAQPATAWVFANHDFPRLATRFGPENARAAALLLLTLPGTAFVYQGDEIGMVEGPGADPPIDRAGRDGARHPMQWDPSPGGGFTDGTPWLPLVDPAERSVAGQRDDPDSLLTLYRKLIDLRRELGPGFELLESPDGMLAFRRGEHAVAINFSHEPMEFPVPGTPEIGTEPLAGDELPPTSGVVFSGIR